MILLKFITKSRLLSLLILVVIPTLSYTQEKVCKAYQMNPKFFIKEVDSLRKLGEYNLIINILEEKLKVDQVPWMYYQLACYFSLKNDTISAYNYLTKAIRKEGTVTVAHVDEDLYNLRKTNMWASVNDSLVHYYLLDNPNIKNIELSLKLWVYYAEDQAFRSLGMARKYSTIDRKSKEYIKAVKKETKNRFRETKNIILKEGFPTYSEVGVYASNAAFLIVQHSKDQKLSKKLIPVLREAALKKETSAENYAMLHDRYLMHNNKKQLYGTQVVRYNIKKENGYEMSNDQFWNIEDEKNVDIRRKELGLAPLADYAKLFGIDYIYNLENEHKPFPFRH